MDNLKSYPQLPVDNLWIKWFKMHLWDLSTIWLFLSTDLSTELSTGKVHSFHMFNLLIHTIHSPTTTTVFIYINNLVHMGEF